MLPLNVSSKLGTVGNLLLLGRSFHTPVCTSPSTTIHHPPPPSFVIMGAIVSTLAFPAPAKEISQAALLMRAAQNQLVYLKTKSGHQIPAIHIIQQKNGRIFSTTNSFTLIYSHGNAEDVGLSLPYLDYLSQYCDCHVLAYEYCGYSVAEGEPSETNCYECIQAAYDYLTKEQTVNPSQIVLFGRSLGTGELY